jgi:hypothetical protein
VVRVGWRDGGSNGGSGSGTAAVAQEQSARALVRVRGG